MPDRATSRGIERGRNNNSRLEPLLLGYKLERRSFGRRDLEAAARRKDSTRDRGAERYFRSDDQDTRPHVAAPERGRCDQPVPAFKTLRAKLNDVNDEIVTTALHS